MSALVEAPMTALGGRRPTRPGRAWIAAVLVAAAGLGLALSCRAYHPHALPEAVGVGAGSLVLFALCGDALAVILTPVEWLAVRPLLSLVFGAAASGMVLMAFGVAHVPLHVSLWVTLALGLLASGWARTRGGTSGEAPGRSPSPRGWRELRRGELGEIGGSRPVWLAVLGVLFLVALIPAWRTGALTIYGQNPDSSQVVGIAVLFQHVPPTHTDNALPLDVVPQEWRFRYPIFYPLAAVAALVHVDPIRAFPVLSALLALTAALGYGLLAVRCFGAPAWAGPAIAGLIGFTWVLQYLTWHPYWNQLWGTALMPYTILFGWHAIQRAHARAGIACLLLLLMLWFAYPLALPYPLVVLAGVLVAYWRRPRPPRISSWRGWVGLVVLLCVLAPAVAGSVLKLKEAIVQLLTPHSALWGGDIKHFVSFGRFAGTGGGVIPAILVLVVAALALVSAPVSRRLRVCLGGVLALLLLLDLRFRLTASGTYMDFKHLSFVGLLVLSLAAAGLLARAGRPGGLRYIAGALVVLWCGAALGLDHRDARGQNEQVTPQILQIRRWAARLPAGSSVRIDIPPSDGGLALWAVYMLGDHPVDSFEPLVNTTYAHPVGGFRADYAIGLSVYPDTNPDAGAPFPPTRYTGPPLFENAQFVIRKVDWPRSADSVPQDASTHLVEP